MHILLATLHSKYIHPSLALPYLAGFAAAPARNFTLREFTLHEPAENILALLLAENPDVIGFSVYLWNRVQTLQLIDALHAVRPEVRIFVGGPEVSFDGVQLLQQHPGLDAVVCGEGEMPVKALLDAWQQGTSLQGIPRIDWRDGPTIVTGPQGPVLENLDTIPSPFALGLVDLSRGFVYYETSRGCPYTCSFCMSSLDQQVRSFSLDRIKRDLGLLLDQRVPKIKLVDRTFNYNAERTKEIFTFILQRNQGSHLHFEIGAYLLDDATLDLLEQVPEGQFQFEIGVQSTLPQTLQQIRRQAPFEKLETAIRRLVQMGNIEVHLDLIAGLPGESLDDFLASVDRVAALQPHHLQIEPVKLLPGAPLRIEAKKKGITFSPHPPYPVLCTPDLSFEEIEQIRALSRLLDLTWNSHRLKGFLPALGHVRGSFSTALSEMARWFQRHELLRHPLSQQRLFEHIVTYIEHNLPEAQQQTLIDQVAIDYATVERITPSKAPSFFDTDLKPEEMQWVEDQLKSERASIHGQGIKLQYFVARFSSLAQQPKVGLFLYFTASGKKRRTEIIWKPVTGIDAISG